MPTAWAAAICGCRIVSRRQGASSKALADLVTCWSTRRGCSRSSVPPSSLRAAVSDSDHARHQALIRPDDHGLGAKLILIDIDHDLLIMKEGVRWPTTETCK